MSAASSRLFGWPVGISVAVHTVAIVMAASVGAIGGESAAPPGPAPIEVVRIDPPPAPPPPPAKPKPPRHRPKPVRQEAKPEPQEKIVAPRLVTQPAELAQREPLPAAALLDDTPRPASVPPPAAESSEASRRVLAGATASSNWSAPRALRGSVSPAAKLLSTGDLPIPVGRGGPGGAGGTAQGRDVASTGDTTTRDTPGDTKGLTSFARPLGGYQTRPRYPDSARREGVEGETLLRFQVLTTGRVASVSVARTAGHPDLDRAAVDAVTTWLFEPARRGREAVAVWVTLPVRFQLDTRGSR